VRNPGLRCKRSTTTLRPQDNQTNDLNLSAEVAMNSLRWNILLLLISARSLTSQAIGLAAYWPFDSSTGTTAIESRKRVEDKIEGYFSYTRGVRGNGIKFDGCWVSA